jgi:hypothetical protein
MNTISNTISTIAARFAAKPTAADQSLMAISLLSCFGLVTSLGLMALGIDVNIDWL